MYKALIFFLLTCSPVLSFAQESINNSNAIKKGIEEREEHSKNLVRPRISTSTERGSTQNNGTNRNTPVQNQSTQDARDEVLYRYKRLGVIMNVDSSQFHRRREYSDSLKIARGRTSTESGSLQIQR